MAKLQLTIRYTIKDRPKGTPGYTGGTIVYGRDRDVPLLSMLHAVTWDIIEHYAQFESDEVLNAELDKFRTAIQGLRVERDEPQSGDSPQPKLF